MGNASYVRKHVDSLAKFFLGRRNCRLDLRFNTYVGTMENALRSCSSNLFRAGGSGLGIDIRREHFCALLSKQQRNRFPDAHSGTTHERNAALQTHGSPWNEKVKRRKLSHEPFLVQRTNPHIFPACDEYSQNKNFHNGGLTQA
jgi:hypothetical protein